MSSVILGDLDADVIGLGEDCTNPLFSPPPPVPAKKEDSRRVALVVEEDPEEEQWRPSVGIVRSDEFKKATVSVSDCLACSGCVTSAETVLLSRQSGAALQELAQRKKIALSISQASLASLADTVGSSSTRVLVAFARLVKQQINALVIHTADAHDAILVELAAEFVDRVRHAETAARPVAMSEASIALSSVAQRNVAGVTTVLGPASRASEGPLPLLTSSCPGVVCFVEKSCQKAVANLASTRSPMAALGALLRMQDQSITGEFFGADVAHVAVMPCADKKLEAARRDLIENEHADVELVLTTQEALELAGGEDALREALGEEQGVDLLAAEQATHGAASQRGGSGGYLDHAFRAAALAFGCEPQEPPAYVRKRNDDLHEVRLKRPNGARDLVFAAAYGFRNVQRVTSQVARGNCPYDFVELMACPSGCLNGGGQLRPATETRADIAKRVARVDGTFHARRTDPRPDLTSLAKRIATPDEPALHTRYHVVPLLADTLNPAQAKW